MVLMEEVGMAWVPAMVAQQGAAMVVLDMVALQVELVMG
jgi:hypothetical protein